MALNPFSRIDEYQNPSLRDQESHNSIMQQLSECLAAINKLMGEAGKVSLSIAEHNTDDTSHEDIRRKLESIGDVSDNSIVEKIRQHDISGTSHASLRAAVNKLTAQTNTKLTGLAANISSLRNTVDDIVLRVAELHHLHDRLDFVTNPSVPSNFKHTLTNAIIPGKPTTFSMSATAKDGHDLEFNIIRIAQADDTNPICKFSKENGIANGEVITVTADPNNRPGAIYSFHVDITDTVDNTTIHRTVCVLMARSFESGSISIDNFPGDVEPNHRYPFRVINLNDLGDGRFTYHMTAASDKVTFNPAEASTNPQFEIIIDREQERDVDVCCTLTVHDSVLDSDIVISKNIHINPIPGRPKFKHTLPPVVNPGATIQVQFYGDSTVDGSNATYKIKTKPEWLTFTPDTEILAHQNVSVVVTSEIARGTEGVVTVTSQDVNDVEFDYLLNVKVNRLPTSDAITTTLPASNIGGRQVPFRISGGTDPDDDPSKITYSIDPGSSNLVFSKVSGITPEEDVQVTLPKVADDTPKLFTVYAVDSQGERAPDNKTVNITVTPSLVADPPRITAPTDGAEIPYEGFTVTWTEFTFHTDVS